jgi:sugar/nucleoside kinase (ribokinase family)
MFLGWERVDGVDGKRRDFYIRQLRDWKGIAMPETMSPLQLETFGGVCGLTLARAHARSGDRIAIASYLGKKDSFDRALVTFAEAYADQNERDHQALVDAVKAGQLPAEDVPAD